MGHRFCQSAVRRLKYAIYIISNASPTIRRVIRSNIAGVLGENDSQTTISMYRERALRGLGQHRCLPLKMPINVTMEEPRAWIVCYEANGDIIGSGTDTNRIPSDRVCKVVSRAAGDSDNIKCMLTKSYALAIGYK